MEHGDKSIANFELRKWEPTRRVGVRRTIADLKTRRQETEDRGQKVIRSQRSGVGDQKSEDKGSRKMVAGVRLQHVF